MNRLIQIYFQFFTDLGTKKEPAQLAVFKRT